jgi:hypothetical protein
MELETGEEIIWKGRSAYHIRYPTLTVLSFIGILVINLGPVGKTIGATSFVLWILFLVVSLVSVIVDKRKRYYLTKRRVISQKSSLLISDLSKVRLGQSKLGRLRGVGNVYFDSKDGRWIVFKHVNEPGLIVQSGLHLTGTSVGLPGTVVCNYCGARAPAGALKCPTCGADM